MTEFAPRRRQPFRRNSSAEFRGILSAEESSAQPWYFPVGIQIEVFKLKASYSTLSTLTSTLQKGSTIAHNQTLGGQ